LFFDPRRAQILLLPSLEELKAFSQLVAQYMLAIVFLISLIRSLLRKFYYWPWLCSILSNAIFHFAFLVLPGFGQGVFLEEALIIVYTS